MRIQCDNCLKKPASILCCADEAALCEDCDKSIHFANKLSLKHQRVSLFPPPLDPNLCDMCKEKPGYFFCTQDRALLCRDCDVAIHSGSQFKLSHTRLLVTGARVGLEALPNGETASAGGVDAGGGELDRTTARGGGDLSSRHPNPSSHIGDGCIASSQAPLSAAGWLDIPPEDLAVAAQQPPPPMTPTQTQSGASVPSSYPPRAMAMENPPPSSANRAGGLNGVVGVGLQVPNNGNNHLERQYSLDFFSEPLRVEDLLALPQISGYQLGDVASSKGDDVLGGQFDWPPEWSLTDELRVVEDTFHQVPSMTGHAVVTSGRMGRVPAGIKGKGKQDSRASDFDDGFVVPDMGYQSAPASPPLAKRRRQ